MKCPSCKTEIREDVSFKKKGWKHYKIYTFFCPMCELRREIIIDISKENYNQEIN